MCIILRYTEIENNLQNFQTFFGHIFANPANNFQLFLYIFRKSFANLEYNFNI